MYTKRNIKKSQTKPSKGTSQASTLISTGKSKYVFPTYPDIQSGYYFSKIDEAKPTKTKSGDDAIEVFYEIKNGVTCYQIANGMLPKDTEIETYYIKQVYPTGTQYYEQLVDSMAEALGNRKFYVEDIIGVTEYVSLSYNNSNIGGFNERYPFEMEDFIQQDIEQTDYDC